MNECGTAAVNVSLCRDDGEEVLRKRGIGRPQRAAGRLVN